MSTSFNKRQRDAQDLPKAPKRRKVGDKNAIKPGSVDGELSKIFSEFMSDYLKLNWVVNGKNPNIPPKYVLSDMILEKFFRQASWKPAANSRQCLEYINRCLSTYKMDLLDSKHWPKAFAAWKNSHTRFNKMELESAHVLCQLKKVLTEKKVDNPNQNNTAPQQPPTNNSSPPTQNAAQPIPPAAAVPPAEPPAAPLPPIADSPSSGLKQSSTPALPIPLRQSDELVSELKQEIHEKTAAFTTKKEVDHNPKENHIRVKEPSHMHLPSSAVPSLNPIRYTSRHTNRTSSGLADNVSSPPTHLLNFINGGTAPHPVHNNNSSGMGRQPQNAMNAVALLTRENLVSAPPAAILNLINGGNSQHPVHNNNSVNGMGRQSQNAMNAVALPTRENSIPHNQQMRNNPLNVTNVTNQMSSARNTGMLRTNPSSMPNPTSHLGAPVSPGGGYTVHMLPIKFNDDSKLFEVRFLDNMSNRIKLFGAFQTYQDGYIAWKGAESLISELVSNGIASGSNVNISAAVSPIGGGMSVPGTPNGIPTDANSAAEASHVRNLNTERVRAGLQSFFQGNSGIPPPATRSTSAPRSPNALKRPSSPMPAGMRGSFQNSCTKQLNGGAKFDEGELTSAQYQLPTAKVIQLIHRLPAINLSDPWQLTQLVCLYLCLFARISINMLCSLRETHVAINSSGMSKPFVTVFGGAPICMKHLKCMCSNEHDMCNVLCVVTILTLYQNKKNEIIENQPFVRGIELAGNGVSRCLTRTALRDRTKIQLARWLQRITGEKQ